MDFEGLKFSRYQIDDYEYDQACIEFDNGFGLSIIPQENGLYDVCVMRDGAICPNIDWQLEDQTQEQIKSLAVIVENLPKTSPYDSVIYTRN